VTYLQKCNTWLTDYCVSGNAVPTVKTTLGTPLPGVPAGNEPSWTSLTVREQYYAGTCNFQPITTYRPVDGISLLSGISRLLTEYVPDDRHHGRGAAHFLATYCSVIRKVFASCLLHVVTCSLQVLTYNLYRSWDRGFIVTEWSSCLINKITFVRTRSLSNVITFSIQPTWRPLYEVMWRHRLRDQSIRHRPILTGGPLELILYLLPF